MAAGKGIVAAVATLRATVRINGILEKVRHGKSAGGYEYNIATVVTLGHTFDLMLDEDQVKKVVEGHMVQAECKLREFSVALPSEDGKRRTADGFKLDVVDISRVEEPTA